MRIVLDTNVLARAAIQTSGLARELLLRCAENPHVLVLSEFIIRRRRPFAPARAYPCIAPASPPITTNTTKPK
jgi:predicted nucleic acid-binding protein